MPRRRWTKPGNVLAALDKGDKNAAALERATGKLDLVVSGDPKLALAPVSVTEVLYDLYATPETVKDAVKHGCHQSRNPSD
jgi:hypothetical protein